jgi:CrcB protein
MMKFLMLATGAVVGAISRYFIGTWFNTADFPYGTMLINIAGCLVIGFFGTLATEKITVDPNLRIAVQIGFLGSFTTFSSFGYETLRLLESNNLKGAMLNFLGNNGLGLLAVWLGIAAARALEIGKIGGISR